MTELADVFALIPDSAWIVGVSGFFLGLVVTNFAPLRQRYHQWRLDRRIAQGGAILREEYREYSLEIGGDKLPLDILQSMLAALGPAIILIATLTLNDLGYAGWLEAFLLGFGALSWIYALWRKVNDPPSVPGSEDDDTGLPEAEIPKEAWIGIAFGVALSAAIVLYFAITVF